MIKVLIVDDEINICNLICNIIDWNEIGLDVVGVAQNGLEAYSLIKQHEPDIVITDIKMPGLDGLELIKKTIDEGIKTHFIILSGYKQFDYAHTAIKYGVKDYLVKPILKSELLDVISNLCQEIKYNSQKSIEFSRIMTDVSISFGKLHKKFLSDIINGDLSSEDLTPAYVESEYHYKLTAGYFCIGIIHIDENKMSRDDTNLDIQFSDILSAEFVITCADFECIENKDELVFFTNYSKNNSASVSRSINYIFSNIKEALKSVSGCSLTIGLGSEISSLQDIRKSYLLAVTAIKSRFMLGSDQIIRSSQISVSHENIKPQISSEILRRFNGIIDGLNKEQCVNEAVAMFSEYLDAYQAYPYFAPDIAVLIVNYFIESLMVNFSCKFSISNIKKQLHAKLSQCNTLNDLQAYIVFGVMRIIQEYFKINDERDIQIISAIKQYVHENYAGHIEIPEVASHVYLSPTYLGLLFKQQTGQTFSEYLTEVRMQKAKELLSDYKLSIKEISHRIGYKDIKYFSKLFKKTIGLKPTEYRKINKL